MPEFLEGQPAVLRMEPLRMALQETVLVRGLGVLT